MDYAFDADENIDETRETIPNGNYTLRVTQADLVETKARNGKLVKLAFEILGPTCTGRWVFDQFVVEHVNDDAQRIGKGKLSECTRALRTPKIQSLSELVGQTCDAKIAVVDDPNYGPKSEIKRYLVPAAYKGAAAANPARDAVTVGKHTTVAGVRPPAPPPHAYDDDGSVPF